MLPNKKLLLGTLYLRSFGLLKIPMLAFVSPSLVAWDDDKVVFKIPLNWRTKNHLGCMYFAALAAGADMAAGFLAMDEIRKSQQKVSLIFKDLQANFLKRAEGDVHFTCDIGAAIKALVKQTIETGERVELPVPVVATVPSKLGKEPVATFTLTLSLKKKEDKKA
jgi:acyl-coenzyme A thioesterase PaaI-like protein